MRLIFNNKKMQYNLTLVNKLEYKYLLAWNEISNNLQINFNSKNNNNLQRYN